MSKIEEKSREFVLPHLDKQYEKYGEHKQMELSRFDGYDMMTAYEEGYHQAEKDLHKSIYKAGFLDGFEDAVEGQYEKGYEQAEKDLELTWEDVRELHIIFSKIDVDIELCKTDITAETLGYYQEVLKLFKEKKENDKDSN